MERRKEDLSGRRGTLTKRAERKLSSWVWDVITLRVMSCRFRIGPCAARSMIVMCVPAHASTYCLLASKISETRVHSRRKSRFRAAPTVRKVATMSHSTNATKRVTVKVGYMQERTKHVICPVTGIKVLHMHCPECDRWETWDLEDSSRAGIGSAGGAFRGTLGCSRNPVWKVCVTR
jgi:hypothetical protein